MTLVACVDSSTTTVMSRNDSTVACGLIFSQGVFLFSQGQNNNTFYYYVLLYYYYIIIVVLYYLLLFIHHSLPERIKRLPERIYDSYCAIIPCSYVGICKTTHTIIFNQIDGYPILGFE